MQFSFLTIALVTKDGSFVVIMLMGLLRTNSRRESREAVGVLDQDTLNFLNRHRIALH